MPEVTVYDNQTREVPAKILRDPAGRAIVDPITGLPLLVDENFDLDRAMAFGRSLRDPPIDPFSENPQVERKGAVYSAMYHAFQEGGPLDVQRSYNNKVGGEGPEFVKAFRPAASYIYGLVARAAGLSPEEIIAGGGLYNLLRRARNPNQNISGPWFNAPPNVPWIEEGMKAYDSGRFIRSAGQQARMDQTPPGERPPTDDSIMGGQPPPQRREQPPANFAAVAPQPLSPTTAAQSPVYQQTAFQGAPSLAGNSGLPQRVIDAGNLLRANGYEITPRTMYLAHVLGPQGAVDLMKRTGSTGAPPEVPSPDAAIGDQMRAWVRALRLGPAAAGIVGGTTPALNAAPATPDQSSVGAVDPAQQFAWGAALSGDTFANLG